MAGSSPRRTSSDDTAGDQFDHHTSPVTKVFQLLDVVVDAPDDGVGVREIARRLELPVSSVHRLLVVLVNGDLVSQAVQTRRYSIGPESYRLAARITRTRKLSDFALPAMQRLTEEFNETVLLGVYLCRQNRMMFTARHDGTHVLQYRIPFLEPLPLLWGASGKSILAFLDEEVVELARQTDGPSPAGGTPLPGHDDLRTELAQVRRNQVAVSTAEKIPGARGVAAPLFGPAGVAGCLCVTSPVERHSDETVRTMSQRVVEEAKHVSDQYSGLAPAWTPAPRLVH